MVALLPVLLVEMAPPDPPSHLAELLLGACNQGIRQAECVLAERGEERESWGIAIISWHDDRQMLVRIEVGRRAPGRNQWRSRQISFRSTDTLEERWRTVGFAVATLAEDGAAGAKGQAEQEPRQTEPARSSGPAIAPPGSPARTAAAESPVQARHRFWTGLGVLGGPGLEGQPWRWGARGRLSVVPWRPMMATGSMRWAMQPSSQGLSARWIGFSVGVGYFASPFSEVRFDTSGELIFEDLAVSATEAGVTDRGSHSSTGALARLGVAWPAHGSVAARVDFEGYYRRPAVGIWLHGSERVGTWPALGWSFGLAVEWRIR